MNSTEKEIVGEFQSNNFTLEENMQKPKIINLHFKKNKTFLLEKDSFKISGDWSAKDYGDFVIVYLETTTGQKDEARFYSPEMEIYFGAPSIHLFPEFKKVTFKKVNVSVN